VKGIPLSNWVDELESGARPTGGIKLGVGEVPSLGAEHLSDDGGFNFAKDKRIPLEFFNSMKKGRVRPDDILIVKDGATTGKVSFVGPDFPYSEAAINEHVFRVSVSRKKADPRFVFRYLQSPRGQQQIMRDFRGATVGGIGRTFVNNVFLPEVGLDEQRRIATILDKADAIRRKVAELKSLENDIVSSEFDARFRESGIEPVQIDRLLDDGYLVLHKDGNHGSNYPRKSEFGTIGVPFITAKTISEGSKIDNNQIQFLSERKAATLKIGRLAPNDVLLAHNATVGPVCLYDGRFKEAIIGTSLTAFRCNFDKLWPEFLVAALRHPYFQNQLSAQMSQSTRNQVPITSQRRLKLIIPPITMQKES
jgi:type I restriction enzyme S subunit